MLTSKRMEAAAVAVLRLTMITRVCFHAAPRPRLLLQRRPMAAAGVRHRPAAAAAARRSDRACACARRRQVSQAPRRRAKPLRCLPLLLPPPLPLLPRVILI